MAMRAFEIYQLLVILIVTSAKMDMHKDVFVVDLSPSIKCRCKSQVMSKSNHNYLKNDSLLPRLRKQELQSFKITFIPRSCNLDPDESFFYLCGKVKDKLTWQIQHYSNTICTVTPSPWYSLM